MRLRLALGQFLTLLAFWVVLSGRLTPLLLGLGVASAALVTLGTHSLTASVLRPRAHRLPAGELVPFLARLVALAPWLLWRIVVASFQIARLTLRRDMGIRPVTLEVPVAMTSPVARTALANSISLTPGTITVEMRDDRFVVHALTPEQAEDLVNGEMQRRIAWVFGEGPQPPVDPASVQPHDPCWLARLEDDR